MEKTIDNINLAHENKKKPTGRAVARSVLNHAIVIIAALFIVVPLYIVIITSFKTSVEANGTTFYWWPKMGFSLEGYKTVLTTSSTARNLVRAFGVTLWMYVPTIAVGVVVSALAAYGFAKVEFFLKKPIFAILMSALTLPNCVGMIASVIIFDGIGWMGTPLPLMIPKMMGSIGVVFFLRQFYAGLPDDLLGAARVDGLGDYGIFFRIALPLSMPAIGSQFILTFIGAYNDYLGPLYYLLGYPEIYPLQLSLAYLRTASNADWQLLMSGTMVATIPMVCLYLASQKFILKGVAVTSGLKG